MGHMLKISSEDKIKWRLGAALKFHQDPFRNNPTVFQDVNPTIIPEEIHEENAEVQRANFDAFLEKYGITQSEFEEFSNPNPNDREPGASAAESPDLNNEESNDPHPAGSQPGGSSVPESLDLNKKESNDPDPVATQPSQASAFELPESNKKGNSTSGDPADDEETEKETLISPNKEGEIEPNGTKCVICDIEQPPGFTIQAAECGHHFCPKCFNDYVLEKFLKVMNPSVSCPKKECTENLSGFEILAYLLPEVRNKWVAVKNHQGIKKMEAKLSTVPSDIRKCLSMLDNAQ